MKRKTPERRKAEKELLYYLEIFTELRGRNGAEQSLAYFDILIDEMVDKIKKM